jgi:hypothetical protein
MAAAKQVKKAAKDKIVADEAVAATRALCHVCKGHLQPLKKLFKRKYQHLVDVQAQAAPSAKRKAHSKKLLLHSSLSRYRPPWEQLDKWMKHAHKGETLRLQSGCIIMLRQPGTPRPGRSFHNPTREVTTRYNDSIGFGAIALLHAHKKPQNEYDEASHLCGHKRCIEPTHLVWEDMGTNVSRNLCHMYNAVCTHVPACIAQVAGDREAIKAKLTKYFLTK